MEKLYYAIVGDSTNTNVGLGRFLLVPVVFILIGGSIFWALSR